MTRKRIHFLYGIVLSLFLAVSGILLIGACWSIYNSGERPFSPEAVAAAFRSICIPIYLTLALILCGLVFELFLPSEKKKSPPERQYSNILKNLHRKLDLSGCNHELRTAILRHQKERLAVKIAFAAVTVICSIVFLIYAVNPDHFDDMDINGSMIAAMGWFLPCLALPFGFGLFAHYFGIRSIQKETQLVRQAIAESPAQAVQNPSPAKISVGQVVRWGILIIGIGIFFFGLFTGGTVDVLTKAVNICTECVGLG